MAVHFVCVTFSAFANIWREVDSRLRIRGLYMSTSPASRCAIFYFLFIFTKLMGSQELE
jgi:hypothetical protein